MPSAILTLSARLNQAMQRARPTDDQLPLVAGLPSHKGDTALLRQVRTLSAAAVVPPHFVLVQSLSALSLVAEEMHASGVCAVDTETTGLDWTDRVVCLGVYVNGKSYVIPHQMVHAPRNFDEHEIADALGPPLELAAVRKLVHNGKFDAHKIRQTFGIEMHGIYFDSSIAMRLLNENEPRDLESISVKYLNAPSWKIKQDGKFNLWPMNMACLYLGRDVEMTAKMADFQILELAKLPAVNKLFWEIEMPTAELAYRMERRGIAWDPDFYATTMRPEVERELDSARAAVQAYSGPINLDSPLQLSAFLFDTLKLPCKSRSTDKRVLQELRAAHPVIGCIERYRKYGTIYRAFVLKLPKRVHAGRVHTSLNTVGAKTGRMSSADPNLQNLPKQSIGPLIRKGFVPSPGCVLVALDYSQIELRLLAHFSGDAVLVRAFADGKDVHSAVAHETLGVSWAELEADKDCAARVKAKAINFGLLYGMGLGKLVDTVNGALRGGEARMTTSEG
ncbi:MAG: DNA polymerase, partial [Candidatus Dormibacteria bacterium]